MGLVDRLRLDGEVAVVIGPAKAIGRGIAITLAEAGADVALASRTQADLDAVATGSVPTGNFDDCMGTETPEKREQLLAMTGIAMGRYGTPEDIAAAVVYVASPAASWVTGQCLYVTGGR